MKKSLFNFNLFTADYMFPNPRIESSLHVVQLKVGLFLEKKNVQFFCYTNDNLLKFYKIECNFI